MAQATSTGDVVASGTEAGPPAIAGIAYGRHYAAARAAATRDTNTRSGDAFDAWCAAQGLAALPVHPGIVAVYRSTWPLIAGF